MYQILLMKCFLLFYFYLFNLFMFHHDLVVTKKKVHKSLRIPIIIDSVTFSFNIFLGIKIDHLSIWPLGHVIKHIKKSDSQHTSMWLASSTSMFLSLLPLFLCHIHQYLLISLTTLTYTHSFIVLWATYI